MESYRGGPLILNLGSRWRWVVKFTPLPLYLLGKNPSTQWIGGWMGRRAFLDILENRNISCTFRDSNLGSLSLLTITTRLFQLPEVNNTHKTGSRTPVKSTVMNGYSSANRNANFSIYLCLNSYCISDVNFQCFDKSKFWPVSSISFSVFDNQFLKTGVYFRHSIQYRYRCSNLIRFRAPYYS
jgi:hypothetical protein